MNFFKFILLLSILAPACHTVTFAGQSGDATTAAAFSTEFLKFEFKGKTDYRKEDPQAGYSYRFESQRAKLDEYHYMENLPSSDAKLLKAHFDTILKAFDYAIKRNIYKDVKIIKRTEVKIDNVKFLYAKMDITLNDGQTTDSYLYIAVHNGEFLKYRITIKPKSPKTPTNFSDNKYIEDFIKSRLKTSGEK